MPEPWVCPAVMFECGHRAILTPDEYGDGSAWCQQCGDFMTYDDTLTEHPFTRGENVKPKQHVTYTDHDYIRQHYADVGGTIFSRGPEGTLRQCRAWLRNLYHDHPMRDAIVASAVIEDVAPSDEAEDLIADYFAFETAAKGPVVERDEP